VPVVRVVEGTSTDGAGGREVVLEVGAAGVGEGGAVGEREEGQRGVLSTRALVQLNKHLMKTGAGVSANACCAFGLSVHRT
jgi:hypothetical protein